MKPVEHEKVMLVHDYRKLTRPQIALQHSQEQSQQQINYLVLIASHNYVPTTINHGISAVTSLHYNS